MAPGMSLTCYTHMYITATLLVVACIHVSIATIHSNMKGNILPNLPRPQALQGHDDENYPFTMLTPNGEPTDALRSRYSALAKMQPGIRRYNLFWETFEVVPSQGAVFACPPDATLTPANENQRTKLGYHRFHCYSDARVQQVATVLALDQTLGAQNGAIIYAAPNFYHNPNCTGFVFGKDNITTGCVPADEHMDDFEDYILMLTLQYYPALRHFVVWNEVASAGWMDMSPLIPNRMGKEWPLTDTQFDLWVEKYADMVRRTARAIKTANVEDAVMVWTSNDRLWDRPVQNPGDILHSGVKPFQDRLWQKIGKENFTFAMAVHPYDPGNPYDSSEFENHPYRYTFATLGHVLNYTRTMLRNVRELDPDSTEAAPYQLMYASEQGWPAPACCNDKIRSRNICYAHALSSAMPEMIGVTHNFFQDSAGGSEQGGQDYGLIAGNITTNFSNGAGYPTFDSYTSTSPEMWEKNNDHFCCMHWQMGCKDKTLHGNFDPIAIESDNTVQLHGWVWDEGAAQSGLAPTQIEISVTQADVNKAERNRDVMSVVADVSRPDIVHTWEGGSAPNANHGFLVTIKGPKGNEKMTITVTAKPSDKTKPQWRLPQSPQCVCGNTVCAC